MAKTKQDTGTASLVATGDSRFFDHAWWPLVALAGIVWLAYGNSIANGFVFFDDDKAILYNTALQKPSLSRFFSGQNLGMYAPVTWISYWIGYIISGKEAWGYHLISAILHMMNAMLVFGCLKQLSRNNWLSFAAAALFAVHPVQTEAVSWAAAQSAVLFSTFYLASWWFYIQWRSRTTLPLYLGSLALFLLACLSKSAAVTLPLVLVLSDFYIDKKLIRKYWLSKIPYLLLAIAFGVYTFQTREIEGHNIAVASSAFSLVDRFFMVSQTILFYPVKLLAPLGFSIAYPFVKTSGSWDWSYLLSPLVLIALAALTWLKFRKKHDVLLGIGLYLLPLTVMLPFRTVGSFELRSDRYVYISSVGIFWLTGLALSRLQPTIKNGVLALAAILLTGLTLLQTRVWKDGESLFQNCVKKTPESSLCQCNLAYNSLITNKYDAAIEHYSVALKYDPSTVEAYNGRGQAYMQIKKFPEALADFDAAIKAGISTPKLFLNRGKCLVITGKPVEAGPDLDKSISLEPNNPEAWYFRGVVKEKENNMASAISDYSKAINLNPKYIEAIVNRGMLYFNQHGYPEAIADFTTALDIAASHVKPMILTNRANAYLLSGELAKAKQDVTAALAINPEYPRAQQTRAALAAKGY